MMKKITLGLLLFLAFNLSSAQDIFYGIRGALNVSNLDFEPDANFENKHRNGFAFAGFVEFQFSENVSLLTEIQWSAEGGKDEALRADYIQAPIQLRYALSDKLKLGVGPQVALKTWENEDRFNTFTFSGVIGAEYMITSEIFVDARYTYGFSNILDSEETDLEANNHVMQFGIGIKL